MIRSVRITSLLMIQLLTLVACTSVSSPQPPLVVTSNGPIQLARERGYVACVIALHRAYPERSRLLLKQRYRARSLEEDLREFHLEGWVIDQGKRQEARFVCTTERFGRTRVLRLERIQSPLLSER